jgi:hypothetical protein
MSSRKGSRDCGAEVAFVQTDREAGVNTPLITANPPIEVGVSEFGNWPKLSSATDLRIINASKVDFGRPLGSGLDPRVSPGDPAED